MPTMLHTYQRNGGDRAFVHAGQCATSWREQWPNATAGLSPAQEASTLPPIDIVGSRCRICEVQLWEIPLTANARDTLLNNLRRGAYGRTSGAELVRNYHLNMVPCSREACGRFFSAGTGVACAARNGACPQRLCDQCATRSNAACSDCGLASLCGQHIVRCAHPIGIDRCDWRGCAECSAVHVLQNLSSHRPRGDQRYVRCADDGDPTYPFRSDCGH